MVRRRVETRQRCKDDLAMVSSIRDMLLYEETIDYTSGIFDNVLVRKLLGDVVELVRTVETPRLRMLRILEHYMRHNCLHDWVKDYVEVDVEHGINIEYCVSCECNRVEWRL